MSHAPTPSRILVRGVNWLGDAVMTTPALIRLREHFPQARITLLCHEKLLGLWKDHPALNDVRTFADGDSPWNTGRRLREGAFDLAVVFPNSFRSALEPCFAGIPRRIGGGNGLRRWLLTQSVPPDPTVVRMRKRTPKQVQRLVESPAEPRPRIPESSHQLHHYLRIVGATGASTAPLPPRLGLGADELQAARAELFPSGMKAPVVGLNAGAEYGPAKRWPIERFAEAANRLHEGTGCRFLIFGGPADLILAGQLSNRIRPAPVTVLAGRTTLRQLVSRLACCDVLLTNDTGPMHVAAALGVPVVVPFGSTSPELTGPGNPGDPRHALIRSEAACSPCFLRQCPVDFRCMKGIEVATVVEAIQRILSRGRC